MATYAFFNMPAYGHVNPTLPIVQELVRRGHKVSYYLTEDFREVVQATGATFQPYESKVKEMRVVSPAANGTGNPPQVGPTFIFEDKQFVPPQIIDRVRAEQPDVIVYDYMCTWARPILDEIDVPAVITKPTYASNEHFNLMARMREGLQNMAAAREMRQRMLALMSEQGKSSEHPMNNLMSVFSHTEELNIIFIPKEFQPEGETFDERFLFVGPSILPRHAASDFPFDQLKSDRPLLYISLGSVFNNRPDFYKQCFAAFADQPWQVLLSIGKYVDPGTLGHQPDNFLLSPYAPQLDILPRTRLFITHAGTNSIMESMYFGVPMVLIPQQPEQQMHAQRVVDLGLGVMLDGGDVTASMLREAVDVVSSDDAYREQAQKMQQSVRLSGGYQRAADALIQFAMDHKI